MMFESGKTGKRCIQLTHPAPVEVVSNSIFGLVGAGNHPCVDMLNIGPLTRCVLPSTAVINMNVSTHRRANEVAHHGRPLVISGELATSQLNTSFLRSVNSPSSLSHRAVAGFVLLLGVALKKSV